VIADGRRRFRRTLLIFGLAGPFIGLVIALCLMVVIGLFQGIDARLVLLSVLMVGVVSVVFAPLLGVIPALSAGVVAALLQQRRARPAIYYPACGLAGAVSSAPISLVLESGLPMWTGVGAATAVICARLTRQR
jgi:hypothetical protein